MEFNSIQVSRALDLLMAEGQQVTQDEVLWVSPMGWAGTVQSLNLLQGPTFKALWELGQQAGGASESDDLRELLHSLSPEEGQKRLVEFLKHEIARILRIPEGTVSATDPVSDLGVDSLMGVELGLAAQKTLGDDIPLMTISDANSIQEIANKMIDHIHRGSSGGASANNFIGDLFVQHTAPSEQTNEDSPIVRAAE